MPSSEAGASGVADVTVLFRLPPDAREQIPDEERPFEAKPHEVPAGDKAQGLALRYGKGRVVILGEAAMLTAQLAGGAREKVGMNMPGLDNRQFVLNTMRWLAGVLD